MHVKGIVMKMSRKPQNWVAALAMIAATLAFASPARADLACGSLMMPAGQLKEVSRGITAHHAGLDLVAPHGSPLRAAAAGTVIAAHPYFAYGLLVDIDHGNGVMTRYAHMASFAPGIRPGVQVAAGQLLGQVGRTGRATTAHVHFEVRVNGRPVDPKPYLSLAACTPKTPTVRFDEARARSVVPVPASPTPGTAVADNQVADARAARNVIPLPPSLGRARAEPRVDARPGGLLD